MNTMKSNPISRLALAGSLLLALGACGDADEVDGDVAALDSVNEPVIGVVTFDPLSRDYQLTPEQQQRRTAVDMNQWQSEYSRYRDEMAQSNSSASGGQSPSGEATSGVRASGAEAASDGAENSSLRPRSEMDFNFLDRNNDGRLSVAEYAIWAVPVNPNKPKPNDERKPYITADQANKAADSFFYFDQDGNTYLSETEYASARSGRDPV